MHIHHDPDEWMTVCDFHDLGRYGGAGSIRQVRRPKEEVARIKAERRQREEDEILRKADAIRAARKPKGDRMAVGE